MSEHFQHVRYGAACLIFCLAARGAEGQQFQEQGGVLPVPTDYWTESVSAVDADEDGRWDVLFVHANGWAEPGDFHATGAFPLPPLLLVNTGTGGGNPVFTDQSAAYLPAGLRMHGKGASVADFDGDGHDDIVLAVAFGGTQCLLIKDPATLAWIDESARLPEMHLNCFGAGVGDLDDDGDLDIVFSDAARPSFSAPGGKARLCINDGTGHFTEQAAWIDASNKIGAQNAKIVDIDNDFDLDVIVDGKSPQTQLYFNDGQAHFTENDTLIPSADEFTYETEWGDLDNDNDIDGLIMSLDFFTEGTVQNFSSDTGRPSFRPATDTMTGLPAGEFEDDNEFVLIDVDDDGDLDAITVSLQSQQEKLYVNSGTFGPGFLHFTPGVGFSTVKDSSLDMCVADFDGDGDYDAVTGQGESFNFTDRYYKNQGPADSRPPRIGRVESAPETVPLAVLISGQLVRHAWLQDATWDDGWTFETARLLIDAEKRGVTGSTTARMSHSGGQIFRGVVLPPPSSTGLVGTRVSYRVEASDPNGNTSVSPAETFVVCGCETYGPESSMTLVAGADPTLGASFAASISGGPPGRPGLIAVGTARASHLGGTLLVDPSNMALYPVLFDDNGSGRFSMLLPSDPAFTGLVLDLQAVGLDPSQPQGLTVSNGLEVALCAP
jgi:hypothetical protein